MRLSSASLLRAPDRILLRGLDPERRYRLEGSDFSATGAALMYGGFLTGPMSGDYPAEQYHFTADKEA